MFLCLHTAAKKPTPSKPITTPPVPKVEPTPVTPPVNRPPPVFISEDRKEPIKGKILID